MNEIKIYRLPFFTRFMMFAGVVFFGVITFPAFRDQQDGAGYVFVGFAGLCLIAFIWSLYTIRITDNEITVTNFLRTKTLAWNEVVSVEHKADDGFRLTNHDEDVSLRISSQVEHFFKIVEAVKRFAPEPWKAQDVRVFHLSGTAWSGLFVFGFTGFMMLYVTIKGFANGGESLVTLGFLFIFGIISIGILFIIPFKISIDNEYLIISSVGRQRRIHVRDVESVFLEQTVQQSGYVYRAHVKLKNNKTLRFASLREGTFALATSLEKWLQRFNNPDG